MKKKASIAWSFASALVISSLFVGTTLGATKARAMTTEEKAFATAVDTGTYAYDIDRTLSNTMGTVDMPLGEAWRPAGSDAEHEAANYLKNEMRRIGLKNVQKEGFPVQGYTFRGASVQIMTPTAGAVMLGTGYGGIPGTPAGGVTAPAVYVGIGAKADYAGKDVTGKIVLVDVNTTEMNWLHIPAYEAELHGAAGIIVHWVEFQTMDNSVATFDSMSRPNVPVVGVSNIDFATLKTASENGATVTMKSDATINPNATSYNVVGYIPGTTDPDKLIIIGAHYDKWWYGASDDSGGIAQMLAVAKAMVDSNYKPTHTIVFLATAAEEYGWSNTNFDWAIGSYAFTKNHPDWAGKTLAYFMLDNGAGIKGATTIAADGSPEMYSFRKSVAPVLDEYFSNTAPWSAYYTKSSASYALPTTWGDEFSFGASGIPTMSIITSGALTLDDFYHTQMDDMNSMSAESLGMATIANGVTMIRLDRANVLPFNMDTWGKDLDSHLKQNTIQNEGIDVQPINTAILNFRNAASDVWTKIQGNTDPATRDEVNKLLLKTEKKVASELITVGGYDFESYPHEHYQTDAPALRKGLQTLNNGNVQKTLENLRNVNGMWEGSQISRQVYEEMVIGRHNPNRTDLFWATGRMATFTDLYDTYFSIAATGNTNENVAALTAKHDQAVNNLEDALNKEITTLTEATALLREIENAL